MTSLERDARDRRLLALLSVYLNERPDFITADMVRDLGADGDDAAFALLFAGALGLDAADDPEDRDIFLRDFPRMLRARDQSAYANDAYTRAVRPRPGVFGALELKTETIKPYEAFVSGDMRAYPDGARLAQIGYFKRAYPYLSLRENGREWMSLAPNEIDTIFPVASRARGNVLALGLGLGYFAFHACANRAVARVTVVEKSEALIALFNRELRPFFVNAEKLNVICADAFDYAPAAYAKDAFDFVFADLWHDAGDGAAMYKKLKALENPAARARCEYWIEDTLKMYLP